VYQDYEEEQKTETLMRRGKDAELRLMLLLVG
jgi:hypothetical protein